MQSEISNYELAYANLKIIEKNSTLKRDEVYGIGVQGKRFKLVKKDDPFFARIWFSIKKFFHIIKVDSQSIATLKDRVSVTLSQPEYKDWAKREGKITKQGRIVLIDNNKKLSDTVGELEQKQIRLQQNLDSRTALYEKEVKPLKEQLKKANKEISHLQKQLEKKDLALGNLVNQDLEKKLAEYMAAWTHISPEKSVNEVLEEYNSKKSTIETFKDNTIKYVKDKRDKHRKDKQPSEPSLPSLEKQEPSKKDKSTAKT